MKAAIVERPGSPDERIINSKVDAQRENLNAGTKKGGKMREKLFSPYGDEKNLSPDKKNCRTLIKLSPWFFC